MLEQRWRNQITCSEVGIPITELCFGLSGSIVVAECNQTKVGN